VGASEAHAVERKAMGISRAVEEVLEDRRHPLTYLDAK
jgi:hypothetical protein